MTKSTDRSALRAGQRLRLRLGPCLLASILCASPAISDDGEKAPAPTRICKGDQLVLREVLERSEMLLLGEIHGSEQVPAFALEAVCEALDGSRPVVLGLEIWNGEQERIDAFLRSPGAPADRRRLIEGPFWQRSAQDGRASRAVVELIDGIRELIAGGSPVSIFCFDEQEIRPRDARDRRMATHLLAHREAHPEACFVILTGNVHAGTTVGVRWNPELRPMGWYLDSAIESLSSLRARNAAGEFWVCNPDCGAKTLGGKGAVGARGVSMFRRRDDQGYDGVFDIGAPTASAPAKAETTASD